MDAPLIAREDVKRRVHAVSHELHALAARSLGPAAHAALLQPSDQAADAAVMTTSAERQLELMGGNACPVASVYYHILKSKVRDHCDGGLLTLFLSSKLQLDALSGTLSNVPYPIAVKGMQLALKWCLAYLDAPSCPIRVPVDWSDTAALYAVLRGAIASKPVIALSQHQLDQHLLPLVLETFVAMVPFVLQHPNESIPVRFVRDQERKSIAKSQCFKSTVLLDKPWPPFLSANGTRIELRDISVALFSVSLDPLAELVAAHGNDSGTSATVAIASTLTSQSRLAALRTLADALVAHDVRLVLSQKLIPRYLQLHLASQGVVAIERLEAVQMLTGALPIGDLRLTSLTHHMLGFVSSVSPLRLNGTQNLIRLHRLSATSDHVLAVESSSRAWPVATLVLGSADRFAHDELVHVINVALKRLVDAMEAPEALAGAGCTEIHLANWLRRHSELLCVPSLSGSSSQKKHDVVSMRHLRVSVDAVADALEAAAAALDHGIHARADELIYSLRKANHATLDGLPDTAKCLLFGWNPHNGHVQEVVEYSSSGDSMSDTTSGDSESDSNNDDYDEDEVGDTEKRVLSARVLDSLAGKRDALITAIESATTLLRVAAVVNAS